MPIRERQVRQNVLWFLWPWVKNGERKRNEEVATTPASWRGRHEEGELSYLSMRFIQQTIPI
ncbi:MAG: hypothetical protein ACREOO_21315 [bacterium]